MTRKTMTQNPKKASSAKTGIKNVPLVKYSISPEKIREKVREAIREEILEKIILEEMDKIDLEIRQGKRELISVEDMLKEIRDETGTEK